MALMLHQIEFDECQLVFHRHLGLPGDFGALVDNIKPASRLNHVLTQLVTPCPLKVSLGCLTFDRFVDLHPFHDYITAKQS